MGRRPGITSDETREQLLAAAMTVFTARGYDGTRVAEIAREAGVTTGAIYNHFSSKADLLTQAIGHHGPGALSELIDSQPELSVLEVFRQLGAHLPDRSRSLSGPMIEIIGATRRDEDVAKALTGTISDGETDRAELVRRGQAAGEVDPLLEARAIVRFTTMVAFGSMVVDALGLDPIDSDDWNHVVARMVTAVGPIAEDDHDSPPRSATTTPQGERP